MNELTIYVTRHGKTLMNTLGRVQGWCDSPLTQEGIDIARYLALGLKDNGIEFQGAYCSDLRRTLQTSQVILSSMGQENIEIMEDSGFKEAGFGSYESGLNSDLWERISLYMHYSDPYDIDRDLEKGLISYGDIQDSIAKMDKMKIAETWSQVQSRTQNSLRKVAEQELAKGSSNVLVVAHGMCIAAMLLSLGGHTLIRGDIQNASVSKVTYQNGKFNVESMGDMSYVEKGKSIFVHQSI